MTMDEDCGTGSSLAAAATRRNLPYGQAARRRDNEGMPNGPSSPASPFAGWGRRDVRASDADRERVIEQLRQNAGDGRLTVDELTQRVEHAYNARTMAELQAVVRDLPGTSRTALAGVAAVPVVQGLVRARRRRKALRFFALRLAIVNLALVAAWALTGHQGGAGFWPIWPFVLSVVWFLFRCVKAVERRHAPDPLEVIANPAFRRAARATLRERRRDYRR
jgi:hypothetical protein